MVLSAESRETLRRWLPMIVVLVCVWLAARALRRSFWTVFGFAWMFCWTWKTMPFRH